MMLFINRWLCPHSKKLCPRKTTRASKALPGMLLTQRRYVTSPSSSQRIKHQPDTSWALCHKHAVLSTLLPAMYESISRYIVIRGIWCHTGVQGKVLDVARVLQKAGPAEVPDLIIGADTVCNASHLILVSMRLQHASQAHACCTCYRVLPKHCQTCASRPISSSRPSYM
jgi:hypothetical protein